MQKLNVTVIIVNHNYGRFIQRAIGSAFYQKTTHNLNIFVVDDCSDDDSWDIICNTCFNKQIPIDTEEVVGGKSLAEGKNIFAIRLPKQVGPSEARNIAIENTLGISDVYCILDADDVMRDIKVEMLCNKFLDNPAGIGVIYGDYQIYNEEMDVITDEYKEPFSRKRLEEECIVHSGSLISKQALLDTKEDTGFYDRTMRTCEDYDLWMRISEKYIIYHVPEILTLVTVHKQNSTYSVDKTIWERNWQRIVDKTNRRKNV